MRRILAIGAHPDDVELGCSAMLQTTTLGRIVVLTRGESGVNVSGIQRIEEAKRGAVTLGAKFQDYNLIDTQVDMLDVARILEKEIEEYKPDMILTMTKDDTHQDHRAIFEGTRIATRDKMCTVLSYITPSSARVFRPTWFQPMTEEDMQVKLNALACHTSQQHRTYLSQSYVVGMARYWAMVTRATYDYVEPYELMQCWESR